MNQSLEAQEPCVSKTRLERMVADFAKGLGIEPITQDDPVYQLLKTVSIQLDELALQISVE